MRRSFLSTEKTACFCWTTKTVIILGEVDQENKGIVIIDEYKTVDFQIVDSYVGENRKARKKHTTISGKSQLNFGKTHQILLLFPSRHEHA